MCVCVCLYFLYIHFKLGHVIFFYLFYYLDFLNIEVKLGHKILPYFLDFLYFLNIEVKLGHEILPYFLDFLNIEVKSGHITIHPPLGDHHLALLLAQSCMGQDTPRQIMADQLTNWAEGGTDALMSPARLTLYTLLAGAATHQATHTTLNTCTGLDWRRALALHLW